LNTEQQSEKPKRSLEDRVRGAAQQLIQPEREWRSFHSSAWRLVTLNARPVNSGVGPLRIHTSVELNVTKQTKTMRTLNAQIERAAQQLIPPDRNELAFHRELE
jgi:hypothetical protein